MQSLEEQLITEAKQAQILKTYRQCRDDPKRFINTFLYTFDPKREPYHWPFNLFPFQADLVDDIVRHIEQGNDLFIEKSREMGATYTVLAVLFWYWHFQPAANFLIGSRKEDIVDNTGSKAAGEISNKEESLFGKLDYFCDHLPFLAMPENFTPGKHRTYMNLVNPENGNVISGESSNANFSRGGRQRAIMLDEFAFWDNDDAAWGSTADTTNCRIVLTTPGIRPNTKAKRLRNGKDGEKVDVMTLLYTLDPRKDQAWIDKEKARRSSDDFAREILIDWEGSTAGVVYPEARQRTIGDYPYQPTWPLFITWDFGLDGVAIQWWQYDLKNGTHRLIDAYMNTDKPIQWYLPLLGKPLNSMFTYSNDDLNAIARTSRYKNAIHYGDPDVAKRSMTSTTLTSNKQELMEAGIYVQTNPQSNDFASRREKTKLMFQKGFEVNDTPGTAMWIECIDNARYPERLETSQATTAINLPIHDWTSHHRTSTEYYAVNFQEPSNRNETGFVQPTAPIEQENISYIANEDGVLQGFNLDIQAMIKKQNQDNRDWRYR
jgi:hypothetical protein